MQRRQRLLCLIVTLLASGLAVPPLRAAGPAVRPLDAALLDRKPVDLLPGAMVFRDEAGSTPRPTAAWSTADGNVPVLRVECFNRPKSADHVDARWAVGSPVRRRDVLLVRFYARAEYAKQESGEAMFEVSVLQTKPEYARHLALPLTVGTEWTLFEFPFAATRDMAAGEGELHLSFGTIPQAVQVAGVQLLDFADRAKAEDLPQTRLSYRGREADAAWRTEALARIETLRTAPLAVRVIDAAGKPVAGAAVEVRLTRPAFNFGTAVDSKLLLAQTPEAETYRGKLLDLFDTAVIENGLKWPQWSGSDAGREQALAASDWLQSHGLRMRGHNLVWPGDKFAPRRIAQMPPPRTELPTLVNEHIRDEMTALKGRMIGWDVVNEILHERDFLKTMNESDVAEWFKTAREADPRAKLFLNEYGMLNGRKSPEMIEQYVALADRLRAAGAPIDALGVQSHIGRQARSPQDVLGDLDLLDKSGLELQVTEFDVDTPDEDLQADYTRDFLIALYSHPSVTGFTIWGFWQGDHWKPAAAMLRPDFSEKPNAKVWREWVRGKWLTHATGTTDADGRLTVRGHLGDYDIAVTTGGKIHTESRTLARPGVSSTIQLP